MYELITSGKYKVASSLGEFMRESVKRFADEEKRFRCLINEAQALKWMGDDDACKKLLKTHDWSASNVKFHISVSSLLDEFKEAADMMKIIGGNGEITENCYRTWPLFKKFRESEEFKEAFKCVFSKDFYVNVELPEGMDDSIDKEDGKKFKITTMKFIESIETWGFSDLKAMAAKRANVKIEEVEETR